MRRFFPALTALVAGWATECAGGTADAASAAGGKPAAVPADVRAFIAARCLDCHDDASRQAGVSLESLGHEVSDDTATGWLRALEQIERGTMPPPDQEQPEPALRHAVVIALEQAVVAHAQSRPARDTTVLRRLNRTEYRRTLEDLLHLDLSGRDPTLDFPEDTRTHGFASDGEKLVTSSFLLRQYLAVAKDVVGRAIHFEDRPEEQTWSLSPPFTPNGLLNHAEKEWYATCLREPQPWHTLFLGEECVPLEALRDGVPLAGWYSIRILAEAKFRHADIDLRKMFGGTALHDPSQPHRLALTAGSLVGIDPSNKDAIASALLRHPSQIEGRNVGPPPMAIWDVPDDAPTWLECRVWLEAGQFPKFSFTNGPTNSNHRLQAYLGENKYTLLDKKQLAAYEAISNPPEFVFFETPRIRLSKAVVTGPLNDQWPPASHRAIFGSAPYEAADAGNVLRAFAERAWRRPVTAGEVEPFVSLVQAVEKVAIDAGTTRDRAVREAIADGIAAVLCAPEFLYREEGGERLDGYGIATRLSYFLWSSLPDEKLLSRAAAGELARPEVRREEAERLLADVRSDSFVTEFLDGWLRMKKLGSMTPVFPVWYTDCLEPAMRTETRVFFKRLLNVNGPIADFLDSDYTFVNRGLARLYGIDWQAVEPNLGRPVDGLTAADLQPDGAGAAPSEGFVMVKFADRKRGGLLGQASVLTLTANGVDTNPVIRGSWVLETLVGAPPSPPPPNIPVIEPDVRGATTLRQRLEKHRDNPSCLACHRHIDPPGFALESFDAIGRWRGGDTSGECDGIVFKDVAGFKEVLLQRQPQFARCLVEKLLLHLLGRELTAADRPAIRRILDQAAADGYRLKDIVLLSCESDLVTRK